MICLDEEALVRIASGAVEAEERAEVDRHIDGCPSCRRLLALWARAERPAEEAHQPDAPASLVAGSRVGRYVVLGSLGTGSMGSVYLARDPELDRRVALKLLRPDRAASEDAALLQARLQREARAMARLVHPNVIAVHDVGAADGAVFIAMEHVEGVTLRAWLQEKPRSPAEVLPILLQAGQGLMAAHDAGIIHRDFKPDNVLIGRDGKVRVGDFGLAREELAEELANNARVAAAAPEQTPESQSLTREGALVGSPAYMSPEILSGEHASARSDVFSFCVSLHEALFGERPFAGRTLWALREAVSSGEFREPASAARVPKHVRRALRRGLAARPEDRWPSLAPLLAELSRDPDARLRRPLILAAFVALAALASVVGAGVFLRKNRSPAIPAAARQAIAVLPPVGDRGMAGEGWLSPLLAEMLAAGLSRSEQVRVVPPSQVAQVMDDLGLRGSTSKELPKLRQALAADVIVTATYRLATGAQAGSGRLQLALALWDASTGEQRSSLEREGEQGQLFDLATRASAAILQALQLPPLQPPSAAAAQAEFPSDPEASRAYVEGLTRLRAYDAAGARERLERAAALAPDHALARAALAQALAQLGYDRLARENATRAFELSGPLGREERLAIEALALERSREWPRAIEVRRALFTFFPDSLEHGLELASAQIEGSENQNALVTIAALRRLPRPAGDDPRIDLVEASAQLKLGNPKAELAAAQRAVTSGTARGARLAVAQGLFFTASADEELSRRDEGFAGMTEAARRFHELGDLSSEARSMSHLAIARAEAGDFAGAHRDFEAAQAAYSAVGNVAGAAAIAGNLAVVMRHERDLRGARRAQELSVGLMTQLRDEDSMARSLHNLGIVLLQLGELPEALSRVEQSLSIQRRLGIRSGVHLSLSLLAEVRMNSGYLDGAQSLLDELFAAPGLQQRAEAVGRAVQAHLLLAEGRTDAAIAEARRASSLMREQKRNDYVVEMQAVISRALLTQGKVAEAARELEPPLVAPGEDKTAQLALAMARALAGAHAGKAAAKEELRALAAQATSDGFFLDSLQARLDLARLQLSGDSAARARGELRRIAREASAHGCNLIASQAAHPP